MRRPLSLCPKIMYGMMWQENLRDRERQGTVLFKDRGRFSVFGVESFRLWFRFYSKDREPSPVFDRLSVNK